MNLRNVWRRALRLLRALTVHDHELTRPPGRLVLFSCHDADRSMTVRGLRFSPLLEGVLQLIRELGFVSINLTHPQALFGSKQIRDSSITINYLSLSIRFRGVLHRVLHIGDYRQLTMNWETQLYHQIFQRLGPELIISIQPPPAMCRAARAMGLKVIEVMHGTTYSSSDKIFGDHMARPDEQLPNLLLCFDDVSHATLSKLCIGRDILAVKANDPWLHSIRLAQEQNPTSQLLPTGHVSVPEKKVLITLQWGYDGERASLSNIIPNGILHPALEAAFAATADSGTRFLLRMHPIQMNKPGYRHHRRYVESLAARYPNLEFKESSTRPLPLLLDEVSAHVTMCSSTVGEAAAAHVPSLMLCPTLHEGGAHDGFFRELEGTGLVTFGMLETDAIVAWIEACPPRDPGSVPAYDAERQHPAELAFYATLIERVKAGTGKMAIAEPAISKEAT